MQDLPPPSYLRRAGREAIAYRALEGASPGVMFLGGFMSDMTGTKATALEAHCRRAGRAFVRFDYSGHGESSGAFRDGTIGACGTMRWQYSMRSLTARRFWWAPAWVAG